MIISSFTATDWTKEDFEAAIEVLISGYKSVTGKGDFRAEANALELLKCLQRNLLVLEEFQLPPLKENK